MLSLEQTKLRPNEPATFGREGFPNPRDVKYLYDAEEGARLQQSVMETRQSLEGQVSSLE